MDEDPRYWYSARRHLWGYRRPLTWEGWLLDMTLFAGMLAISPYARSLDHPIRSLGLVFAILAVYVAIAHWKSEPYDRMG